MFVGRVNKSIFGKILSVIEKAVKTFSIFNETFFKNGIILCALSAQVSKIPVGMMLMIGWLWCMCQWGYGWGAC